MNSKKTKIFWIAVTSFAFVLQAGNFACAKFEYPLLEAVPGFYKQGDTATDFPGLILAIYKFGIWTVGIAGLFMLVIGGFMYMASAGNTATAGNAKKIITDALIGIVVVMSAFLVMYVINPDLTKIKINFAPAISISVHEGVNKVYSIVGIERGKTEVSAACTTEDMLNRIKNASVGVADPCLIFALLNTESGCKASAVSYAGACGISQMMPSTAGKTCAELISNPDMAIKMGAKLLMATDRSLIRGDLNGAGKEREQALRDLYAAYNGGPGTLGKSKDCNITMLNDYGNPFVKWDCPRNPGGYVETVRATSEFVNYYNKCPIK